MTNGYEEMIYVSRLAASTISRNAVENHENEINKLTMNKKGSAENTVIIDESTVVKVERMKREFKTHRCAMDFDTKFLKSDFRA